MKKVIGYFRLVVPLLLFFIITTQVAGQEFKLTYCGLNNSGLQTAIGCIEATPDGFIKRLFSIALGIAGGVALLMIILGGLQIQMSTGDPKKLQQGREIIEGAIIGLLMIIFSIFILRVIGVNILGIPGFK